MFSGTLVGGGLQAVPVDGRLEIRREGRFRKMVQRVGQISFNGAHALARGQQVTFITERAVFRLTPQGLLLTEIAPGVDLQAGVLDQMDFRPLVSPELRLMDERIFRAGPMGLRPPESLGHRAGVPA